MAGSFEPVYEGDMLGMSSGGSSLDAFGTASTTKGVLDSPESNFPGRSMSEGAMGDPGNALPSASGMRAPSSDGSFECMADSYPSNARDRSTLNIG